MRKPVGGVGMFGFDPTKVQLRKTDSTKGSNDKKRVFLLNQVLRLFLLSEQDHNLKIKHLKLKLILMERVKIKKEKIKKEKIKKEKIKREKIRKKVKQKELLLLKMKKRK